MKQQLHIGTKVVEALPMTRLEYNQYRGWKMPANENGSDKGFLVEYMDGGESNHENHIGYISWSPITVFNNSYKASGSMSFGMATEMAIRGCTVQRVNWNGSGMYAYIVPARKEENSGPDCLEVPYIYYREHWALKTAQGDIATWSPSGSDSLGNDWAIVHYGKSPFMINGDIR